MSNDAIREVLDAASVPTEDGEPVFDEEWHTRIFSLAVAMRGRGNVFEWKSFQQRLVDEIAAAQGTTDETATTPDDIENEYYYHWMGALERLLIEQGHIDEATLQRRTEEFMNGDRTAAEFVEGEHHHDGEHHQGHDHPHHDSGAAHGDDSDTGHDTASDSPDDH